MNSSVQGPERRPLKVTEDVQAALYEHYMYLRQAQGDGKPILLAPMAMPFEVFHAMDIPIMPLEGLGGIASAAGQSARYCQIAEEHGHSRDICSFTRCFSGIMYAGDDLDPLVSSLYTQPDVLVGTSWACSSQNKAFQYAAQYLGAQHFLLDAPVNSWGREIPDHAIAYYVKQLKDMIEFLQQQGYELKWDRLAEEVEFSRRVMALQAEIDEHTKVKPCPMGGSDVYFSPLMAVHTMGQKAFHLLEKKRDEVQQRAQKRIGVIDDERVRLLWFLSPPVYNLDLLHHAEKDGAVVVQSWIEPVFAGYDATVLDPDHPLESIARKLMCRPDSPNFQTFPEILAKRVKDFQIDGLVNAVMRSCGLVPGQMRRLKDRVFNELGVPTLMIDADYSDERECDAAAIMESLDSFVAALLARKGV
jgi:benzoyl-CoA reductase/2-hydroxyglutaryl-CoA dehydratase subunit BcrC/BadD/HgdB